MLKKTAHIPGLLLILVLSSALTLARYWLPLEPTLMALLIGMVLSLVIPPKPIMRAGIGWTESVALGLAVSFLAVQLNLNSIMQLDGVTLLLITSSVVFTFVCTLLSATRLGVGRDTAVLVASGQGICGSAAIMAAQQVVVAPRTTVAQTIMAVNLLGFVGIFLLLLLLPVVFVNDDQAAGTYVGNTLQSMGHVVGAGFSLNQNAGQTAVLVKMYRILLLVPTLICILVYWQRVKKNPNNSNMLMPTKVNLLLFVPWFIWVFLLLLVLNHHQLIPLKLSGMLSEAGDFLFVMAMLAIGFNIRASELFQGGGRIVLLAAWVFVLQLVVTGFYLYYLY